MRVLNGYHDVPRDARGAIVAIGNFDGVHRGHQAVLERARVAAAAVGAKAGVMTFEPHPLAFFQPGAPHFRLTELGDKLRLLEGLGLDLAIILKFDAALAGLEAEEFVDRVLVDGLGVGGVVVGYDFHFGKGRRGTPQMLLDAGTSRGFTVTVIEPQQDGGDVFSSTKARKLIAAGEVREAAEILGHWWRVTGEVVPGARRGRQMGFPTANIALAKGVALAHGIYAVRVAVNEVRHAGAAYLGRRPTFDSGAPVLEVHILDWDSDLYGRRISVDFLARLRGDKAFPSAEALAKQMEIDCRQARDIVAAVERDDPMHAYPLGKLRG
jgi:riboflavin kinase/FMN adenylyltransferase